METWPLTRDAPDLAWRCCRAVTRHKAVVNGLLVSFIDFATALYRVPKRSHSRDHLRMSSVLSRHTPANPCIPTSVSLSTGMKTTWDSHAPPLTPGPVINVNYGGSDAALGLFSAATASGGCRFLSSSHSLAPSPWCQRQYETTVDGAIGLNVKRHRTLLSSPESLRLTGRTQFTQRLLS